MITDTNISNSENSWESYWEVDMTTWWYWCSSGSWTNCNIYSTTPSKSLGTICLWCLFHSWKTFSMTSTTFIKTLLAMEVEGNRELAFLDTLLKWNNGKISVLVYRKPTYTEQYLCYSSHHQTSCKESVVFLLFNRTYSIITNKDDLPKENAGIKQVLKRKWISWKHCY